MLLQVFIGEHADAARQCAWQWISGHDPSCGATPMIRVPRINGKTGHYTVSSFRLSFVGIEHRQATGG